jgi:hypothetical protein
MPPKVGACYFVLLVSMQKITHRGGAQGAFFDYAQDARL